MTPAMRQIFGHPVAVNNCGKVYRVTAPSGVAYEISRRYSLGSTGWQARPRGAGETLYAASLEDLAARLGFNVEAV